MIWKNEMIEKATRSRILVGTLCCVGLHFVWLIHCIYGMVTIGEVSALWFIAKWLVPVVCAIIGYFSVANSQFARISLSVAFLIISWFMFDPTSRVGKLIGWQFNERSKEYRMQWDGSLEFRG